MTKVPGDLDSVSPQPDPVPQSSKLKITAVETLIPDDIMPGLMLLRIHTDAGITGNGETFYVPQAVAAVIHDWLARRLLGSDPLSIEHHWRFFYERMSAFGSRGAEMRALSAVDLALWDILGQASGLPVWQLLGGKAREAVRVYNSCGGPTYGRRPPGAPSEQGWPGHGDIGKPGPLEDNWAAHHTAGDLAEELIAEGYAAMKFWTFDRAYRLMKAATCPCPRSGSASAPWKKCAAGGRQNRNSPRRPRILPASRRPAHRRGR